jgi:hypothetical protein
MPGGVTDRPADVWEPLLAVAELAGDDWSQRARTACLAFAGCASDDAATVGTRLLTDLHSVFGDADVLSTETIWPRYTRSMTPRGVTGTASPWMPGIAVVKGSSACDPRHLGAAASLHEGMAETLAVPRLPVSSTVARRLRSSDESSTSR